jgi:hypothetical protein
LRNFRLRIRAPKGTPKGSRDLRSLQVTFHDVTSSQKAPTKANIAQHLVTHVHTQGNPKGVTWPLVTSGSTVGHAIWYYCTTTLVRKKARKRLCMGRTYFRSHPVIASSGHLTDVTSDDFPWRHFRSILWILCKCDLSCLIPKEYICLGTIRHIIK